MSDPLEPLKKIGDRLHQLAAEVGLDMNSFAVLPDFKGSSHMVQAMFTLHAETFVQADAEIAALDEEQAAIDDAFAELTRGVAKDEEQERANAARDRMIELQQRLAAGKSLLDEPEA